MKKTIGLLVACLAGLWGATVPATAAVIDSVNADKAPVPGTAWSAVEAVGWLYTPSFSYDLTGIQTKFDAPDPHRNSPMWYAGVPISTITVEIYDAFPGQGGHLLRSAQFLASTDFAGGTFPSLSLVAGHPYFVDFSNINYVGVNITADAGATSFDQDYVHTPPDVLGDPGVWIGSPDVPAVVEVSTTAPYTQPILRFLGEPSDSPSSAPEPAGVMLLGMGVLPLLRRGYGRGRSRRV